MKDITVIVGCTALGFAILVGGLVHLALRTKKRVKPNEARGHSEQDGKIL